MMLDKPDLSNNIAEALRRSTDPNYQVDADLASAFKRSLEPQHQVAIDTRAQLTPSNLGPFGDLGAGPNCVMGMSQWVVDGSGQFQERNVQVRTNSRGDVVEQHNQTRTNDGGSMHGTGNYLRYDDASGLLGRPPLQDVPGSGLQLKKETEIFSIKPLVPGNISLADPWGLGMKCTQVPPEDPLGLAAAARSSSLINPTVSVASSSRTPLQLDMLNSIVQPSLALPCAARLGPLFGEPAPLMAPWGQYGGELVPTPAIAPLGQYGGQPGLASSGVPNRQASVADDLVHNSPPSAKQSSVTWSTNPKSLGWSQVPQGKADLLHAVAGPQPLANFSLQSPFHLAGQPPVQVPVQVEVLAPVVQQPPGAVVAATPIAPTPMPVVMQGRPLIGRQMVYRRSL